MPEFTDLDIDADIDELDEGEAKKTLAEFVEKHQKNREAYDELQTEYEEKVQSYEEDLSDYEEKLDELKFERAEQAAEHVNMPADLISERFSLEEIDQIIDEANEHSEPEDEPSEEEGDDSLTSFGEQPAKGSTESKDYGEKYRDEAREMLREKGLSI